MSLDFQLSKNNKTVTKLEPYFDLSKHQKLVTLCSTLVYENEPKEGMLKKQKFQWHKSGSYEDPSYFTTKRRDYAMYEKIIFMHNEITNEMFQVKKLLCIFQKNPMKIYDFFSVFTWSTTTLPNTSSQNQQEVRRYKNNKAL